MKNNRNVAVAMILSLIVLVGWQYFIAGPKLEAQRRLQAAQQSQNAEIQKGQSVPASGSNAGSPVANNKPGAVPGGNPAVPGSAASASDAAAFNRDQQISAGQRVAIDSPAMGGSINLTGGRVDDILLKDYHLTTDRQSPLIELFAPAGTDNPYYAEFGWVPEKGGPATPNGTTVWQTTDKEPLKPGHDVDLTWDNGGGLVFKRTYSVDDKYMITVHQSVQNNTAAAVTLYPYGLVNRVGVPAKTGSYVLHEGMIGYFGHAGMQEIAYSKLDKEKTVTPAETNDGWLGITDKYWAADLIPRGGLTFKSRFVQGEQDGKPSHQADYLGSAVPVAPGASVTQETLLFAGAKEVGTLNHYEDALKITNFGKNIDWGWLYFITQPMYWLIDHLNHLFGNFGLAILAVTVIVKLIFFPLANRSYSSMSKMKKVQPQVKELQERFKDDRMGLQQAMMQLYKQEKINPVAGCWPMVIQIPVFFSLYKVLSITIEMRHAHFFGLVQDLSAPDPTSIFNLFGLVPFSPPFGQHLGIWAIILGCTMFAQMRMNPTPPDKTQAMMFNWMPVVFTFMMANFPIGLVIYYSWNNLLSVLQQSIIMRRNGVKNELVTFVQGLFSRRQNNPAE
ncbi:protein translocase subunit yidC [Faunimonas pinastri]|uniref:Membrane protein insertase YidC n=1 Tax=Faunimonas pinastri TaxID=1855383 RepID=A0A1H9HDD2_9HYPH|nr:membrane protein insertase YidC [Faunimonas pinastri]SEQ60363.1 protein translocase subunit yidC [Faunimonas pinastri]